MNYLKLNYKWVDKNSKFGFLDLKKELMIKYTKFKFIIAKINQT